MEKATEYYLMKGIISDLPKEDQEKIESLREKVLEVVKDDIMNGAMALGFVGIELEKLIDEAENSTSTVH